MATRIFVVWDMYDAQISDRAFKVTWVQEAAGQEIERHFDPEAAIYLALTRPELDFEVVNVWGWSPEEYERWLARTLEQQFLPLPAAPAVPRRGTSQR
jgi:hypothetical protein